MELLWQLILLALGFALLVKGADFFVDGAAGVAERFGIPQLVIGMTIVAMGTSLPEASVSVTAAMRGSAAVAVGNIVGSNILNILLILGVSAAIAPLAVAKSTVRCELPFMLAVTLLLLYFGSSGGAIGWQEGAVFWALFLLYLGYLFKMSAGGKQYSDAAAHIKPLWQLALLIALGAALILGGSRLAVTAAISMAQLLGLSERFIGLTIVALGTSLPELATSAAAAWKGKADIAIGNVVGSNIFNILFVLGSAALLTPVPFESAFVFDSWTAIASAALLWLCVLRGRLERWGGVLLLAAYGAYFYWLLG